MTPDGHYEYNRLPQGWKNSPSVFQRFMSKVLNEVIGPRVVVYIDDICIGGKSYDECKELTLKVLRILSEKGLNINYKKCEFCVPQVKLLGRVIDGETKRMKEEVIEKVRNIKKPTDLKSLQCFLGLTNHFRAFIKDYAKMACPLESLKKKDVPFIWSQDCQQSFEKLVERITSAPILSVPNDLLPYELATDASYYGSGSILYQRDTSKPKPQQLKVISYQSYTFSRSECNYSVTEKECLAVVKAIKHFRTYLEGKKFTIITDHRALTQLLTCGELRDRLARWQLYMRSFDFEITYRKGANMGDADALSRLCIDCPESVHCCFWSRDIMSMLKTAPDGRYLVNPSDVEVKRAIMFFYHDDPLSGGHGGFWQTFYKIRQRFQWKSMKRDVSNYVKSCHECQIGKFKYRGKPHFMNLPIQAETPFEKIHLDFAELKKRSDTNRTTQSFLIIVDEATRFVWGKSMKQSTKAVIDYFEKWEHTDKIKSIITDRGRSFISKEFELWALSKNIILKTTSPYHPQANGLAERTIQDIKMYIQLYEGSEGRWKDKLYNAIYHHNSSYSEYLGCTPYFKFYQNTPKLKADELFDRDFKIEEKPRTPQEIAQYRQRIQNQANKGKRRPPKITKGDLILVQLEKIGKNFKLIGPHEVTDVKYINGFPSYITYKRGIVEDQAHISNCIKYHLRRDDDLKDGDL